MLKQLKTIWNELHVFLILWSTQALSSLGSSMTNFALVIWCYQATGSALSTSLLSICSYAPYVLFSMFAGALSDRWSKKAVMLVSDSFAAICTVTVLVLLKSGLLELWHLYVLNALNGMMNTIQQPAADVAVSLLTPKRHYQKVSGMRSFSNSLVTVLTPVIATALLSFTNIETVIYFDLITFGVAFLSLLFLVRIPTVVKEVSDNQEKLRDSVRSGLNYLRKNRGILDLILFLAAINLTASIYHAALPSMILSRANGGEIVLGMVNTVTGIATLLGSIIVSVLPAPKSRVRVICNALMFSMSTENFFLAFGRTAPAWCLGAMLFGAGKGSGAAMLFFLIGLGGVVTCLIFRRDRHLWELE